MWTPEYHISFYMFAIYTNGLFFNLNKMASNLIKHICIFALFCGFPQIISFEKYDIIFSEIMLMIPVIKVMEVICDIQFVKSVKFTKINWRFQIFWQLNVKVSTGNVWKQFAIIELICMSWIWKAIYYNFVMYSNSV